MSSGAPQPIPSGPCHSFSRALKRVGGAFITLNEKMRERLWARVNAKAKPLKGVKVKPGT